MQTRKRKQEERSSKAKAEVETKKQKPKPKLKAKSNKAYTIPTSSDTPLLSFPFNFVRGGEYAYNNGALANRSLNGYYWSRSACSLTARSFLLYFHSLAVYQGTNDDSRGLGFSLR